MRTGTQTQMRGERLNANMGVPGQGRESEWHSREHERKRKCEGVSERGEAVTNVREE